ncbi:MAG: helix-turn-helix transcriptional regulator [Firmicutes bacterium]|nr:helix-turn-helix transcriptional regulator [Bacillota bacterium]
MSMRELAGKIGVSPTAIAKYEHNEILPRPSVLLVLPVHSEWIPVISSAGCRWSCVLLHTVDMLASPSRFSIPSKPSWRTCWRTT